MVSYTVAQPRRQDAAPLVLIADPELHRLDADPFWAPILTAAPSDRARLIPTQWGGQSCAT
jgi:hypothetical protein